MTTRGDLKVANATERSPLSCKTCPKKQTCTEICPEVNKILKDAGINSADWIRPRVSPKRDKKQGMGRWREIPSGLLRPGIDNDYAGDIQ